MIDAHVHIWGPSIAHLDWLDGSGLPTTVDLDQVTTPGGQVVLITADASGPQALAEARAFSMLSADPRVHGFVAGIDLLGDVEEQLAQLLPLPGLVGVRHNLQDQMDTLDRDRLAARLRILAVHDVAFDACVRSHELRALRSLLTRAPGIRAVLDHVGKPPLSQPTRISEWADDLRRLAGLDGVLCKLSGLPAESADGQATDELAQRVVGHAVASFGANRCMVGSDRPISTDPTWCARVLSWLTPEHRAAVGRDVAFAHYRRCS